MASLHDLVFRDEDSWGTGQKVTTTLVSDRNEVSRYYIVYIFLGLASSLKRKERKKERKEERKKIICTTTKATQKKKKKKREKMNERKKERNYSNLLKLN